MIIEDKFPDNWKEIIRNEYRCAGATDGQATEFINVLLGSPSLHTFSWEQNVLLVAKDAAKRNGRAQNKIGRAHV